MDGPRPPRHYASPMAARVQLFATCLGDLVFPGAVADAQELLRLAGVEVVLPRRQVCCGQPAFNAGHRKAAARVARTFTRAFSRDLPVVTPSGSCASMLVHRLPELLGVEPYEVWELSSFLDAQGVELPLRNEGRDGRLPRLLPHAPRAARRRRAPAAARAHGRDASRRSPAPTSAAASAARSRCASRRCRARWPTTSSAARRPRGAEVARHRRPRLPDAPRRPVAGDGSAVRGRAPRDGARPRDRATRMTELAQPGRAVPRDRRREARRRARPGRGRRPRPRACATAG